MHDYSFRHTRTGDFRLNYHMVWTTGFNRPVLEGEVGEYLLAQIRNQCEKLSVVVEEIYLTNDSCWPISKRSWGLLMKKRVSK